MESQDNIDTGLRVASFSAYLNTTDENFVLKLSGGIHDPTLEIISPEETPRPLSLGRSKAQEGEIGVFGADKYFNMRIDYEAPKVIPRTGMKVEHVYHVKPKLQAGTPSVSSESSWNSQTALLPSLVRNPSRNKQKKGIGRSFFTGFACNGPCMDKKSVHTNQRIEHRMLQRNEPRKESFRFQTPLVFDEVEQPQAALRGEEHFEFPVLKSARENFPLKTVLEQGKLEEEPRYSIEVFGSHMIKRGDIAMNLERKLSMLTWDAIPKSQNLPSTLGSGGPCDDIQSDASSDLFEIDTLSGAGHPLPLLAIDPSETQYEPSEASIEWSVVTASAADFSVVSDYDEKSIAGEISSTNTNTKMAKTKNVVRKEGQKGRPGGLLGCKNQKAVSVAEAAHKSSTERTKSLSAGKPQGDNWRKEFEFP